MKKHPGLKHRETDKVLKRFNARATINFTIIKFRYFYFKEVFNFFFFHELFLVEIP